MSHPLHQSKSNIRACLRPLADTGSSMDYDAKLQLDNQFLRQAYGTQGHDPILDIGDGTVQTTRESRTGCGKEHSRKPADTWTG